MDYGEVEAEIRRLVRAASEGDVRAFGSQTVIRLVRSERFQDADEGELTVLAWAALTTACANVLNLNAAQLRAELTTIDDGILTDGDLDTEVLAAIQALQHWQGYLERQCARGDLRTRHSFDRGRRPPSLRRLGRLPRHTGDGRRVRTHPPTAGLRIGSTVKGVGRADMTLALNPH